MAKQLPATRSLTLDIDTLGARGDGIASVDGRALYVPFTLPGETVQCDIVQPRGDGLAAVARRIERESPMRVPAACRHFGVCGGCSVQHLGREPYLVWKRDLVVQALRRRGFEDPPVAAIMETPPGRRRRTVLTAMRTRKSAILGFHERASHRLTDIAACPVLLPVLEALIAPLRALMIEVLPVGSTAQIALNDADNGVDCQIAAEGEPDLAARETMAAFAERHDLARLSWRRRGLAEPIAQRRQPVLRIGTTTVAPPPGSFLQASREGEAGMQAAIGQWLGASARIVDLFGGIGTLSLGLLPTTRVHVVEENAEACAAVAQAGRAPGLQGRLTTETRDLAREPVPAASLDGFDAAIFDPPRAGAAAQAREMAASAIPDIVAVSCDPGTFARDARILVDGGYALEQVLPIDQFLWSAHVELVARFRKKRL